MDTPTTTTPPASATSIPPPPETPFLPSPDGTYGYHNQYKYTDTLLYFGNCCSAAGFCSWSEDACRDDYGCQSDYGLCDETSTRVADSECDMACAGDVTQTCGGDRCVNIYGTVDTPEYVWLGCRTNEDPLGQALSDHSFTSPSMTNELCGAECVEEGPFDYYGTEDGDICRCGDALRPSSKMAPNNECNVRCLGDTQWDCGGDERLTTFATNPLGPTYFYQGCHTDEDPLEWALLDDGKLAFLALVCELRSLSFFFYTHVHSRHPQRLVVKERGSSDEPDSVSRLGVFVLRFPCGYCLVIPDSQTGL